MQGADHRALFHAAPRYALLVGLLTGSVVGGYLLTESLAVLLAAAVVEAIIMAMGIYVFMRGMGSIEYDNEEAAYRLSQANAQLTEYARRIRLDLNTARTVQRQLLPEPKNMPLPDQIEWASYFGPETEVGGDYFDAAQTDCGQVAMVFADVSGHGMAAALITVIVKMAFRYWVELGCSVAEFVQEVNRDLCHLTPTGSFVVLIAASYDPHSGKLAFVNAGHSPPPLLQPASQTDDVVGLNDLGAMLLGVEEQIPIKESTRTLAPGDAVIFATDGLTEAQNPDGQMFGKGRLLGQLEQTRQTPLDQVVDALVKSTAEFAAGQEQTDDRTVLALRIRPDGPAATPSAQQAQQARS